MSKLDTGTGTTTREHVDETPSLISASKVSGTSVYNAAGEDLGSVHDLMLDKRSGKVAYAVMSFGGFLGIGERYHPLPWHLLTYDEGKGGYNIDLSADRLRAGPSYSEIELDRFIDEGGGRQVSDYYGLDDDRII